MRGLRIGVGLGGLLLTTVALGQTPASPLLREVTSTWALDSVALRRRLAADSLTWRYAGARRAKDFVSYTYVHKVCGYAQKWDYFTDSGRMAQLRVAVPLSQPETLELLLDGFTPLGQTQLYHAATGVRAWPVRGQSYTMVVLYLPLNK